MLIQSEPIHGVSIPQHAQFVFPQQITTTIQTTTTPTTPTDI